LSFASNSRKRILLILALILSTVSSLSAAPGRFTSREACCENWTLSADFLAWYASQEIASIWADVITIGDNTSSWKAPSFHFKWDYGFRVGISRELNHDQWITSLNWTWFRTSARQSIPSKELARIGPEFDAAFLSNDTPSSMNASWSLLFNMFDWQIGRDFCVSNGLYLHLYLGLKGGWINQSIHANYFDLTISDLLTDESGREHLKNNFFGVGPLGGVNTTWVVYRCTPYFINLFGDFSMATMWGTWSCSDTYNNTVPIEYSVNTKRTELGALMFRGFMGLGWDVDLHGGKSHLSFRLGYESQIWLNQLQIATFQLQRLHSDLTFQGVTFNCHYDF
jgi:hypothetical protein